MCGLPTAGRCSASRPALTPARRRSSTAKRRIRDVQATTCWHRLCGRRRSSGYQRSRSSVPVLLVCRRVRRPRHRRRARQVVHAIDALRATACGRSRPGRASILARDFRRARLHGIERRPPLALDAATEVGSYFVANYPPFSVWTTEAVERDATPGARRPSGSRACRSASTCTSRSAGSAATSATSASTPTRTRRRSGATSTCSRANGSCTRGCRRSPAGRSTSSTSAAARRRSCRRSSSRGSSTRLTAVTPWDEAEEITFECEPGTLTERQARGDPRHGRHAPQPRRRELRRSHPRDQRPRASLAGDRPRLRVRPRARLPADQHRPHRRHARRDRRQLARRASQDARARARQRDDLPDGAALQHDDQRRHPEGHRPVQRSGRRTGRRSGAGSTRRSRRSSAPATTSAAPTPP